MFDVMDLQLYSVLIISLTVTIFMSSFFIASNPNGSSKKKKFIYGIVFNLLVIMSSTLTKNIAPDFFKVAIYTNSLTLTNIVFGTYATILAFIMYSIYLIVLKVHWLAFVFLALIVLLTSIWVSAFYKRRFIFFLRTTFVVSITNNVMVFLIYSIIEKTFKHNFSVYFSFLLLLPAFTILITLFVAKQHYVLRKSISLREEYSLLMMSLNATEEIQVKILDANYCYVAMNDVHKNIMKRLYNVNLEIGKSYIEYLPSLEVREKVTKAIDLALLGIDHELVYESSAKQILRTSFSSIRNEDGNIETVALFTQDITKQKYREQEIYKYTYIDALTNVYNRHYFTKNFQKYDEEVFLSLIYIDVNMLKFINDAFGHHKGDDLLKFVANVTAEVFSENADVIRMGGDEFIVIVKNTFRNDVYDKLAVLEEKIKEGQVVKVPISISLGISFKEENMGFETVLKLAEEEMYRNKLFNYEERREKLLNHIINNLIEDQVINENEMDKLTTYVLKIAQQLSINNTNLLKDIIVYKDVGKISLSEDLIKYSNTTELNEYYHYLDVSYRILSAIPKYKDVAYILMHIEENYDGSGYPNKVSGDDIPVFAQIIRIVNYNIDNINNKRKLLEELKDQVNKIASKEVVAAFVKVIENETK